MDFKYVGFLNEKIAKYWKIEEHKNKPILVYNNKIQHVIDRHLKDFGSEDEIYNIYNNLNNIIKRPDYVFYNKKARGLEYYKNINSNVCVVVRINPGKVLKVKSWFPVKTTKITNRQKKQEIEEL